MTLRETWAKVLAAAGLKKNRPETAEHLTLGRQGEDLAAEYLTRCGLKLVGRNVRTPYGEIDLVFRDGEVVVFAEVKTRTSRAFGGPREAVGPDKRRRLSRAALAFLAQAGWEEYPARFDFLAVILDGPQPRLEHLTDAFDLVAD